MYKGLVTHIFFDLDHTLWDFERNSALTFEKIFKSHRVPVDLPDFLKVYVPTNLQFWKMYREQRISKADLRYQRLKTVFDALGHPVTDELIHSLAASYIDHLSTYGHLFPNTVEILDYLRPNYQLHIITNGFQEIQGKKLRNSGIHGYFGHVVDAEMAGVKKPDPNIFKMALSLAKASPESSLMIGDSLEADILGAKAVGLHVLHFNAHGEPPHDHCSMISDLQEIKSIL